MNKNPIYSFVPVYIAHGDGGESNILPPVIGAYKTEEEAKHRSKGKAWYGGDGSVRRGLALRIEETGETFLLHGDQPRTIGSLDLEEEKRKSDAELRKTTIAGLSEDQLRVLGIEDKPGSKYHFTVHGKGES